MKKTNNPPQKSRKPKQPQQIQVRKKLPPQPPKVKLTPPTRESGFVPSKALGSLQDGLLNSQLREFLAHLIAPSLSAPVRPPDPQFGRRGTATATSRRVVDVVANFDATADSGRFAACIQASLGSVAAPNQYKVAMVDSSTGWPLQEELSDPDSFVAFAGVGGSNDIRLDPNYWDMTNGAPGHFIRLTNAPGAENYGPAGPDLATNPSSTPSYNLAVDQTQPVPGTSRIFLPSGVFVIEILTVLNSATFTTLPTITPNNVDLSIEVNTLAVDTTSSYWTFLAYASVDLELDGQSYIDFEFRPGDGWDAGTCLETVTPCACDLTGTTLPLPDQPDSGMIQQIRPIAMSVLYSSTLAPIVDGGEVCISWVPGNTCQSLFFATNPTNSPGPLALYENLGQIDGASLVPHRDGGYAYWTPQNMDDWRFRKASEMEDYEYPCIILSGRVVANGLTGVNTIGRMIIYSSYEILTAKNYLPQEIVCGSQDLIDAMFEYLRREPRAMANDEHLNWLQRLFQNLKIGTQAISAFYSKNKSWLTPAAQAAIALI